MSNKNFAVDSNPSKEDEVNFLKSLVASYPRSGYLSEFFTTQLVAELEQRIRSDWAVDMYGEFQTTNRELSDLEAKYDRDVAKWELRANEKDLAIHSLEEDSKGRQEMIANLRREKAELESVTVGLFEEISSLKAKAVEQENEVIRLKAKLYDLIVK